MRQSQLDLTTEKLLDRVLSGDAAAIDILFQEHRRRLRQMVGAQLSPMVRARVDPSDVVQETILEAHRRLPEYLISRPIPFYPWLRQLAGERLAKVHRFHLGTKARDAKREHSQPWPLADDSMNQLADGLMASQSGPMQRMLREEMRSRVRRSLDALTFGDRQILILRILEDVSTADAAAILGLSESAVRTRQLRALQRFQQLICDDMLSEDSE